MPAQRGPPLHRLQHSGSVPAQPKGAACESKQRQPACSDAGHQPGACARACSGARLTTQRQHAARAFPAGCKARGGLRKLPQLPLLPPLSHRRAEHRLAGARARAPAPSAGRLGQLRVGQHRPDAQDLVRQQQRGQLPGHVDDRGHLDLGPWPAPRGHGASARAPARSGGAPGEAEQGRRGCQGRRRLTDNAATGTPGCREGRARDLGPGDGRLGDRHAERLRQQQQLYVEAPALQPLAGVQPPRRAAREQLRARGAPRLSLARRASCGTQPALGWRRHHLLQLRGRVPELQPIS